MIRRLLVLGCCALLSMDLVSQEVLVSYEANRRPISRILKDIEKLADVHFAFSDEQLRGKEGSVNAKNQTIQSILQDLLTPHQLVFQVVEEKFIAVNKPESVFIRAQVVDVENDEALPFAIVRLKGTNKGIVADEDGKFNLVIDEPLGAILEISFLGYVTYEVAVENYKNSQRLPIKMTPDPQQLDEVVVKEYLNYGIVTDDKSSMIRVNPQDMEVLPGLSERDILLTTQFLPGINSNNETAAGINVRGSSVDNTFIYWNNIPIYHPAHYFGNISSFIPASVGQVDIYKNYVPVSYGNSSAGTILANSPDQIVSKSDFEANLNLTHADLFARFPLQKENGTLMIGARRSFNDWVATPTFRSYSNKLFEGTLTQNVQEELSEDFDYNSKLAFTDLNFKWDFEPSGRQMFSLSGLRSSSVLDYQSTEEVEDEQFESTQNHNVTNYGTNFQWKSRWSDHYYTEMSASYSDYQMNYELENKRMEEDETDNDFQLRSNEFKNIELRFSNEWEVIPSNILQFGAQANWVNTTLEIGETLFLEEDISETIDSEGLVSAYFMDFTGQLGIDFTFGLGMRLNQIHFSGQLSFDPQFRLSYQLNDYLLLKSTLGRYSQYFTTLQEQEFNFSNTVERHWIVADNEEFIPFTVNEQLVVGSIFDKDGWLLDVEFYTKNLDGLIARNLGPGFDEEEAFSQGTERVVGLDVMLKKKWRNYKIWASYGFQDSQAELPDLEIYEFPSILNIRHQFQISQTVQLGQFELSTGYTLKSGLPYTAALSLEFISEPEAGEDEDEFEPYYEINYDELNANRLPTYHRLDISGWYKFPKYPQGKFRGELGVALLNVLNRTNIYNRTFAVEEFEEDIIGIEQQEKFLLGFTPNVSLRLKF